MSDLFGIINVNKPKGLTSHDVVSRLRKILNTKQIGHTGTLDPLATGVLPVCIGKATKVIQYLDDSKAYRAFIKLGIKTDTYDMEGKITEIKKVTLDVDRIQAALNSFNGEIIQKPPIYSAVHYKGKRLYEYARANVTIDDIPERKVTINSIKLLEIFEEEMQPPVLVVDISCSAGTYIRSIAHDLGEILGYGATLSGLIRIKAGKFTIENSYTLDEIQTFKNQEKINEIIVNPVCALGLKCSKIDDVQLGKIKNGQYLFDLKTEAEEGEKIQLLYNDSLAAIAEIREGKIKPVNVFVKTHGEN